MFLLAQETLNPLGLLLQFLLMAVLLGLSAVFSGSEAALFSLTPHQLEQARHSRSPLRRLAASIMQRPKRALMNILVANTGVNVLLYATSYVLTSHLEVLPGWLATPLGALFSVVVVLIGGEVIPKVVAVAMAERLAPAAGAVVRGLGLTVGPLARLVDLLAVEPMTRLVFGRRGTELRPRAGISRRELKALLDLNRRQGVIHPTEDVLLREIIDLRHLRVADVMRPRVEVEAFDIDGSPEALKDMMRRTRRTKIPVYSGAIDNIVGFVSAKILFLSPPGPLRRLERTPARFVPLNINCEQLLVHFRETRSQVAIVVDEYGGMAGLVALEDVLEEMIGDAFEPHDRPSEPEIVPVSEGEYEVSGRLGLHYWAETFGLQNLTGRVVTVGGLVTSELGRDARPGDSVRIGNMTLTVSRLRGRRVERVLLRIVDEDASPGEGPIRTAASPGAPFTGGGP